MSGFNRSGNDVMILIFRTNLRFKKDVQKLGLLLDQLPAVKRWNVALDDCDRILRVESDHLPAGDIIHLVQETGYFCEELPD